MKHQVEIIPGTVIRLPFLISGQHPEEACKDTCTEQSHKREGSQPPAAGDQKADQRYAEDESQRPAKLGDRNDPAAALIEDTIADKCLQGRVKNVFSESGENKGEHQGRKGRPENHHSCPEHENCRTH